MKKWICSLMLLLIWPFVVLKEGIGIAVGDTFSGVCGAFGLLGIVIGVVAPIFATMAGFVSMLVFTGIGVMYLIVGIFVHWELQSEWGANILQRPVR